MWHKQMKSLVAPAYSLSYLRHLEPPVDECSGKIVDVMYDLAGQSIDLGEWLQWYAFDTIGNITFSRTFDFMDTRSDPHNVISGLEKGLMYSTVVGQLPGRHSWLLGNEKLIQAAGWIPQLSEANPITILNKVSSIQ